MATLVSILIPCYNAERWIGKAIESALAQTWPEKEIIVVDDGSTDESRAGIKHFDRWIRWESADHRGPNVVRNRLLELARGRWLQYLDADDYLLPDKIAGQMEFVTAHPETEIVFGPVTIEYFEETNSTRKLLPIPEPHDLWILLARWFLPQTGALLWRKETIVEVGGWKVDQPCCQEHELYLRLLMAGKRFTYCSHNGAIYRQWGEHTVSKREKPEVHRQRLEIEQRLEDFLRETNELTPERSQAISQARFETARSAWHYDRRFANEIMTTVRRTQPDFIPGGDAAPPRYRLAYRLFGFQTAEKLAEMRRNITSSDARI